MNIFDTITDILTNPDKYEPDKQFEANLKNTEKQCSNFAIFDKNGDFKFFENDLLTLFLHNEYADLYKEDLQNEEIIVYGIEIKSNTAYIPEIRFIGIVNKEGKFIKL